MPDLPLGAVIAIDFEKWDVDEEIALIHNTHASLVQVYRNYVRGITAQHIRETLDGAGLVADSMHGYIDLDALEGPAFDLSAEDSATRRSTLDIARGEAEYARVLGCRDVILHPVGPGETAGDVFRPDSLAENARELARIAEAADVRFLIENMPPPMFGADAHILRRIVDTIDSPHLGLAYDSGHANIAKDPVGIVRTMGPRLWGVHLHDNNGVDDEHYLPGMGTTPFEDVARALAQVGFPGAFMLEIYRDTWEVRRDLTPERLQYIHRLRRLASGLSE